MLPIPNSNVFRRRSAALWWCFWVIVAAVSVVGFAGEDAAPSPAANALEQADLGAVLNAVEQAR